MVLAVAKKISSKIFSRVNSVIRLKKNLGEEFFDDLEASLAGTDMGMGLVTEILGEVRLKCQYDTGADENTIKGVIRNKIREALEITYAPEEKKPIRKVVMLWGVNGSGKTTTAAKLASLIKGQGRKVILVAGDTFRAAAIDQLNVWAERIGVELYSQKMGSDPASVVFDALRARSFQDGAALIIDTAGRLQSKKNLMEEIKKIVRIVSGRVEGSEVLSLLVMDATMGQNGISQAKEFDAAVGLDGIILAKYDSTAKGGVLVSVCRDLLKPVYYVGTGEGREDLVPFNREEFISALF